jgi:glutaredoxin
VQVSTGSDDQEMVPRIPQLTLFFRQGCHLCEEMDRLLQELLQPDSYHLQRIDIDEDVDLRARFNVRVPVLTLGEVEICEHFLDLEAVRQALASYNTRLAVNAQASI